MKETFFPQISLPFSNATGVDDVSDSVLAAKPVLRVVINLAIDVSGLQDEQVAEFFETTPGNMSKYRSGTYNYPQDKLGPLSKFLGNRIIPRWFALQEGCTLQPMLSTLEEELAAERATNQKLRSELETITRFVRETTK